jgi:hypothetical protein
MWWVFHLLSTSQYSSCSTHSGHASPYAIVNRLANHFLCASGRYWCRCFRHQGNFYWISHLLGISLHLVPYALDLSVLGDPTGSNATAGFSLRALPRKGLPIVCQYTTSLDHDHFLPHTFRSVFAPAFRRCIHSSYGASAWGMETRKYSLLEGYILQLCWGWIVGKVCIF